MARLDHMRLDESNTRLNTHERVLVRLVDLSERHERERASLGGCAAT